MDRVVQECIAKIKQHTKDEETRLIIADAVLKGVAGETHITKLKEIPELVVCRYLGLKWNNKTMHGHDATDQRGYQVEIKTGIISSRTKNININYAVKDTPQHTLTHYAGDTFKGGHFWVGMNSKKTEVLWSVHLSQSRFLKILADLPLNKPLNFGSTHCKTCKRCKRIDRLAGLKPCSH